MTQSIAHLDRVLARDPSSGEARIEADVGRVDMIIRDLDLSDAKSVPTLSVKKSAKEMFEA
eukprot:7885353-Pyramimonas_sp.AAC.2